MTLNAMGNDNIRTPHLGVVRLYGKVTFGGSGAVSSQTAAGKSGFVFTKPAGTGLYLATFSRKWALLPHWSYTCFNAATAVGDTWEERIVFTSNSTIALMCVDASGSAADATSGNILSLCFDVRNNANGI